MEYYVLVDANGNHMDLMRHNAVEDLGFFGMRLNVDDFDAMAGCYIPIKGMVGI